MMKMKDEMSVVDRFTNSEPVDILGLIHALGIGYTEQEMFGPESGFIEYDGGKYRISVNAGEMPQRKRFTAAHELAHYLLHRDLLERKGQL
ncbi:MAG: ImmA/IrrE family metallo-endopeptidase, partial [Mameliella sp.]|nr:ImmA/IrrE family metallo-endopeptidase [Mameliella sp.]